MPKIQVLEPNLAELIAAGEVIERPASVIKELVENSIDAGAKVITVDIKGGGIRSMRVMDDGCGIPPNELSTAFLRHATSKVRSKEDIYNIATLGFRGEALASIAAVSKINIVSRTYDSDVAYRLILEAGIPKDVDACAGVEGTSIEVSELFYNVPARLKFMKKDSTEANAIASLMERLALTHPEISFRFFRDGDRKLKTVGDGDLKSAIYSVYGREVSNYLVPVSAVDGDVEVSGFLGKPEISRSSKLLEQFYINGRYVKCNTAAAALEQAFVGSIMQGKYPVCFLNIKMPSKDIDVNVHPAKLEIKLTDERHIYLVVYKAVKEALMMLGQSVNIDLKLGAASAKLNTFTATNNPTTGSQGSFRDSLRLTANESLDVLDDSFKASGVPSVKYGPPRQDMSTQLKLLELSAKLSSEMKILNDKKSDEKTQHTFRDELLFGDSADKSDSKPLYDVSFEKNTDLLYDGDESLKICPTEDLEDTNRLKILSDKLDFVSDMGEKLEDLSENSDADYEYEYIGEIFNTYILAKCGNSLILVDKHAAHERILYNSLLESYTEGVVPEQLLLVPQSITLPHELYSVATENLKSLQRLGFEAEPFGANTLMVRTMPAVLDVGDVEPELVDICRILQLGGNKSMTDKAKEILESVACRAAIKGNEFTDDSEKCKLLKILEKTPSVRHCPHGRPIVLEITKYELEKLFGRLG